MIQKFITPKDTNDLFKSISNINIFNADLKYRMKTGRFSKTNPEKSIGIFYVSKEKKK